MNKYIQKDIPFVYNDVVKALNILLPRFTGRGNEAGIADS